MSLFINLKSTGLSYSCKHIIVKIRKRQQQKSNNNLIMMNYGCNMMLYQFVISVFNDI